MLAHSDERVHGAPFGFPVGALVGTGAGFGGGALEATLATVRATDGGEREREV